jgi:uncharacterized protein involved in exopolysaccharide biosynthesis
VGSIKIDKPDPILTNIRDGNSSLDYYDPTDLDTEVRVLRSDLLALQVISQLNLDKLPEFGGRGLKATSGLEFTTDALQPDSARASMLLGTFKGNLKVLLEPNTRIIDIHYRSPNKGPCRACSQRGCEHLHRAELQNQIRVHHAGYPIGYRANSWTCK